VNFLNKEKLIAFFKHEGVVALGAICFMIILYSIVEAI